LPQVVVTGAFRRSHDSVNLRGDLCVGGAIKIDTVYGTVSYTKNNLIDVFAVACPQKHQFPIVFVQIFVEIHNFSAMMHVAPQYFVPRCIFFATFPVVSAIDPPLFSLLKNI
jgi:hypothetical protein